MISAPRGVGLAAADGRPAVLAVRSLSWSAHQVVMRFGLDALEFSTVYWYPDVDLARLERRYGHDAIERVLAHAALFELNKIASLRPRAIDLGPLARHHTAALESLWRTVFHHVWAQWRYENDLPDELPPAWTSRPVSAGAAPIPRDRHDPEVLLFSGGGKDSLVAMKLLERGGVPFASFAYASSVYGPAPPQLALLDGLLDRGAAARRHRQIVLDDFFDAPVLELYGAGSGVHTITAAETPSSIFAALPVLLDRGYPFAVLGHERSANRGNLVWDRTGEEVNHQWGKSAAAERLLDEYVRTELVSDLGIFSVLAPIHDVVIFELLARDEAALGATHSCNVRKPWCLRCPKCAYVWLGCRAHLGAAAVESVFREDLLEVPANERIFHDLVGLGAHTPFECVGQAEESRLALALCQARGLLGPRGRALAERVSIRTADAIEPLLAVDADGARLPAPIAAAVLPQMRAASDAAQARIQATLAPR